jgi:hypothetical protein
MRMNEGWLHFLEHAQQPGAGSQKFEAGTLKFSRHARPANDVNLVFRQT